MMIYVVKIEKYSVNKESTIDSCLYTLETVSYKSAILGTIKNMTTELDGNIDIKSPQTAIFIPDSEKEEQILYKLKAYTEQEHIRYGDPIIDF